MIKTIKDKLKALFSIKRNMYIAGIILFFILIFVFLHIKGKQIRIDDFVIQTVASENNILSVLPTGKVISQIDLGLSFKASDSVSSVRVAVGDKVYKGTILATLSNGDELGTLTQAQGGYRSAEASYQKTKDGATNEEVALSQVQYDNAVRDLENTKRQQMILVSNARRTMLSTGLIAFSTDNSSTQNPTISGNYSGDEDEYDITVYQTGNGAYFTATSKNTHDITTSIINTSAPVPLGTKGLYIQFFSNTVNTFKVSIPNTQSTSYVTNYNSYQSALDTQKNLIATGESVIATRLAELNLKKAQARPTDLELRLADILSAQGRLQTAQASYENTILRAPADGTITRIDIKVGEVPSLNKEVMVLQDISKLYLEAKVNETSISKIALNQKVDFTLDAFGKNKVFKGSVVHIDPSATVTDGIVNYKINVSIDDIDKTIKPGMNADMIIYIKEIPQSFAIPKVAIITENNISKLSIIKKVGKKYQIEERNITLGDEVDGNRVVITSGLVTGDQVIISNKK